jgi:hypothetical protein
MTIEIPPYFNLSSSQSTCLKGSWSKEQRGYTLRGLERGMGWKEQGFGGLSDEGVGEVEGQDTAKFGVGKGGWTMDVS